MDHLWVAGGRLFAVSRPTDSTLAHLTAFAPSPDETERERQRLARQFSIAWTRCPGRSLPSEPGIISVAEGHFVVASDEALTAYPL